MARTGALGPLSAHISGSARVQIPAADYVDLLRQFCEFVVVANGENARSGYGGEEG